MAVRIEDKVYYDHDTMEWMKERGIPLDPIRNSLGEIEWEKPQSKTLAVRLWEAAQKSQFMDTKKSLPFIGGKNDGEYLPVEGRPKVVHVTTDKGPKEVWTKITDGSMRAVEEYRLGKFATASGGMWDFYVAKGLSNDEAISSLMNNYCP